MQQQEPKYFSIFNMSGRQTPTTSSIQRPNGGDPQPQVGELLSTLNPAMPQDRNNNSRPATSTTMRVTHSVSTSTNTTPVKPQKSTPKVNYGQDTAQNERMKEAFKYYNNRINVPLLPNGKSVTIRSTAEYFGVPKSTLEDRMRGKYSVESPPKPGRKPTFSKEELNKIVDHLMKMALIGYGYTPIQAMNLFRFLAKDGKNKEFKGCRSFMEDLFSKYPQIAKRKLSAYEYNRSQALTQEKVNQFFDILEKVYNLSEELSEGPMLARNVWSLDEVGFRLNDTKNLYIITKKGIKNAFSLVSDNSCHITVIFCCNARGVALEPCFIIKGGNDKRASFERKCREAGFQDPLVFATGSAFINFDCFNQYINYFVKEGKYNQSNYSALIMDGHACHTLNIPALKHLNENKVFAVSIPAHTSHAFNIGDVTIFGQMKKRWREACIGYRRDKKTNLELEDFPLIFKKVWDDSVIQANIVSGMHSLSVF